MKINKGKNKTSSATNPFNIKVNRQKNFVLGQKKKGLTGNPIKSRALSHTKSKESWHKAKLRGQKSNVFVDKRLMDKSLSLEERATLRLVRHRQHKIKKSIFNLNEDENLTHGGKPLSEIEKYDRDDSEEEEGLDANFVKQAHFGGFPSEDPKMSHKEIVGQLILESKQQKHERKMEKEHNLDLTEKLDKEWKEMHSLVSGIKPKVTNEAQGQHDPYDVVMNELKFERRGNPSSSIAATEKAQFQQEQEMKQKLKERDSRMRDDKIVHNLDEDISPDSIYDGLDVAVLSDADEKFSEPENEESDDEDNLSSEGFQNETNVTKGNETVVMLPESRKELKMLLEGKILQEASKIIEDFRKTISVCKSEKNLNKLGIFFDAIMDYIMLCCGTASRNLEIVGIFVPLIYTLTEVSPLKIAEIFLKFLDIEEKKFQQQKQKTKSDSIRLQTIVMFKICGHVYSTSDFRHPVVTPAVSFMCDILSSPFALTFPNIVSRLFISALLLEYVSYSKHFVPEAVSFLNKVIRLALNRKKAIGLQESLLALESTSSSEDVKLDLTILYSDTHTAADSEKVKAVIKAVNQLAQYAELYLSFPSFTDIFAATLEMSTKLCNRNCSDALKQAILELLEVFNRGTSSRRHLTFPYTKPKPLKLFEPDFESKFRSKKDDIAKKRKLSKNVSQKLRREEKSLLRVIRKDSRTIAAEKLNEQLEADEERKQKVKLLYQELAMQEGEYKKMMKKK